MFAKPSTAAAVPSRGALRVLRQLALAGSTIGAIGGVCTVATITYDVHRRVRLAERIVENKRNLQVSCPNYDAAAGAVTVAKMMEAAEAGEFMGLDSMRDRKKRRRPREAKAGIEQVEAEETVEPDFSASGLTTGSSLKNQTSPAETDSIPARSGQDTGMPHKPQALRTGTVFAPPKKPGINLPPKMVTNSLRPTAKPLHGSNYEDTQDVTRIQELLDTDKPVQAAQLFLELYPATIKGGISADRADLASKVFYANIKSENVFLARTVFNRIDAIDKVTPALWEVLMLELGKRGSVASVAALYMAHSQKFSLPPKMLELVMRSLISSNNLRAAKTLIFRNLDRDRNCGLSGIYLSGLWKKTRSIELLATQFSKLLAKISNSGRKPTEKLFNPLLRAFIDAGKDEDAQELVEKMEFEYHLAPRVRTRGLFIYAKALRCDWEGVDLCLRELYDLGLSAEEPGDFAKTFDRVFLEFWLANSGLAIRDFVFKAIDEYKLVPDKVLFDHIVEAFVEKGSSEMISELLNKAEKHSWGISFDRAKLIEMIRRRRLASETAPAGLWHMFKATQEKFGQSATSRRILGHDPTFFPDGEAFKMPRTHEPVAWYQRAMSRSSPGLQFVCLDKRMIHAMQTGKWSNALRMYMSAKHSGKVMKQVHVELAVIASLIDKGLTREARTIIMDERDAIRDSDKTDPPLFFEKILQSNRVSEIAAIKMAVFNFYGILEKKVLPCKHHITVAAANELICKGKPAAAVILLTEVYKSQFGSTTQFDAVAMKILVRAFGRVGNLDGIKWGIYSALKRPSAFNRDFVVEAHRTIAALKSRPFLKPNQTSESYHSDIDKLSDLASLLPSANEGNSSSDSPNVSDGVKADGNNGDERKPNNVDEATRGHSARIDTILQNWDEEVELEKAIRRNYRARRNWKKAKAEGQDQEPSY